MTSIAAQALTLPAAPAPAPVGFAFALPSVAQLTSHAGPVALAAFAGVFLGGIALSFFWKNFGPWQMLVTCREECNRCHEERVGDAEDRARLTAEIADLRGRHEVLLDALGRAGLGLTIGTGAHHGDLGRF